MPEKDRNGQQVVYRVVYSGEGQPLKPGRVRKRAAWGALLMEVEEAASYTGIRAEDLRALHANGTLPAVVVGSRVLYRRGDLAKLPGRLPRTQDR